MNQVTLCGNLGRDFDLSYTQNGLPYAKNSLAISKRTTKKEGNETITKDRTDWIPLTIFGRRAEIAHQYFKKGDKFLCNGKITIEDVSDNDYMYYVKQKGVDMKIGIDIATLALKKLVQKIVLISGDSDFVPASKLARTEGIIFTLDG